MTSGVRAGASLSLLTDDIAVAALIVCDKFVLDNLILGWVRGNRSKLHKDNSLSFLYLSLSPQFTMNYYASLIIENNIRNRVCQDNQEVYLNCDTNNLSNFVIIALGHNNQRSAGSGCGFSSNKMAVRLPVLLSSTPVSSRSGSARLPATAKILSSPSSCQPSSPPTGGLLLVL